MNARQKLDGTMALWAAGWGVRDGSGVLGRDTRGSLQRPRGGVTLNRPVHGQDILGRDGVGQDVARAENEPAAMAYGLAQPAYAGFDLFTRSEGHQLIQVQVTHEAQPPAVVPLDLGDVHTRAGLQRLEAVESTGDDVSQCLTDVPVGMQEDGHVTVCLDPPDHPAVDRPGQFRHDRRREKQAPVVGDVVADDDSVGPVIEERHRP